MSNQTNSLQISKSVEMAERTFQSGDLVNAERLFQQILATDPNQPRALNFFAMKAAAQGDHINATSLFEKAIASKEKVSIVFANYAKLLRIQNRNNLALQMLDQSLKIDPNVFALHFEKASIYEAIGQPKNAALAYQSGLLLMPESVKNLPALQDKISHAYAVAQDNQKHLSAFLELRLGKVERFAANRQYDRFSECLDLILGKKRAHIQKPQMVNFPQLPAIPFFNRNDFEWVPKVESYFKQILSELATVIENDDVGFIPYVYSEAGKDSGVFKPLCDTLDWGAYFLVNQGTVLQEHCNRCPNTLQALECAPQVEIKKRGPTSFFSSLKPGTHIPPHNGATNTRLTVHLPLIVPDNCALRVGNHIRTWNPGELMIFDDTIEHEAWNSSDQRRIVLIFDVWNPLLTALERELVATTVEGIVDYYGAEAPLGEL